MGDPILGIVAPHPPIIVSEVGGERARVTAGTVRALESCASVLAEYAPETLVLMSPHAPVVRDGFLIDDSERTSGDLGAFGARSVAISAHGDPALARAIVEAAAADGITVIPRSRSPRLDAGELDHGALVPLSFLDRRGSYRLVELSLSFLPLSDHRLLGRAIRRAVAETGRRTAFIASGDCSHRLTLDAPAGFAPEGTEFDATLVSLLGSGDFAGLEALDPDLIEAAGECGLRSFVTLGGFLEGSEVQSRVLAYEGPWGVGYLTALIGSPGLLGAPEAAHEVSEALIDSAAPGESELVALARRTIDTYVRERRVIAPPKPSGILAERHGAFVSLHREGDLRGCIGTIGPTQDSLADEIVHNAIQAATADPRFPELTPAELRDLEISVDVLHEAEPATMADLDPRTYGVIVSADWRRGLLLPDLEGVDTAEQQVGIALRKAGIGMNERFTLERFRVDRYR